MFQTVGSSGARGKGNGLLSPRNSRVLLVDSGGGRGGALESLLNRHGWATRRVAARDVPSSHFPTSPSSQVVLLDCMSFSDAFPLLEEFRRLPAASTPVVILDAQGSVHTAVEAMRRGASDYLAGPIIERDVIRAIESATGVMPTTDDRPLGTVSALPGRFLDRIVGDSPAIRKCIAQAHAAAGNLSHVLIVGESGTGKDLIARGIHLDGIRREGPYTPVNCAAIPRELIEGELFGYTRGAFSGAVRDNPGLFRGSEGGTIFLDELTEMPTQSQAKLLRAVQEKAVRPVGTHAEVPVDVRVVAATNRDLGEAIEQGRLRRDLYYRLSVIPIHVPPLRERPADIPLLLRHLTDKFETQFGTRFPGFTAEAAKALSRHSWPGNVRELENLVEGFFALGSDGPIHVPAVVERLSLLEAPAVSDTWADLSLETMEKELIRKALQRAGGDKTRAAEMLGMSRMTLYRKLKETE